MKNSNTFKSLNKTELTSIFGGQFSLIYPVDFKVLPIVTFGNPREWNIQSPMKSNNNRIANTSYTI